MNKAELIEKVAKETTLSKSQSETVIDAIFDIIATAVSQGDEVKLVGFGSFLRASRKARTGRNPKTGARVDIPESTVPKFKPGKDFRELCN